MALPETDTVNNDIKLSQLERDFYNHGFDIFHPFCPKWYNGSLVRDNLSNELMPLPENGRGYLIGNTKHLWPLFKNWYKLQQSSKMQDPLDKYCRECIETCLAKQFDKSSFTVFWSAKTQPGQLVSMQRVAMETGFAYHDSTTQLAIHPTFGAWHAYRAVVILHDADMKENSSQPTPIHCLLSSKEQERAREAMTYALKVSDTDNLCRQLHGGRSDPDLEAVCKAWIAMRDCVNRGKEYRYDHDQLMYHYTKDIKYLKRNNV